MLNKIFGKEKRKNYLKQNIKKMGKNLEMRV